MERPPLGGLLHGVTLVPAAASCRCRRRQGRVLDLRLFAGQAATRAGSAPPRAGATPFPSGHSQIAWVRHLWCSSPRTGRCRSVGSSLAPRLAAGPKGWQCCPPKAQTMGKAAQLVWVTVCNPRLCVDPSPAKLPKLNGSFWPGRALHIASTCRAASPALPSYRGRCSSHRPPAAGRRPVRGASRSNTTSRSHSERSVRCAPLVAGMIDRARAVLSDTAVTLPLDQRRTQQAQVKELRPAMRDFSGGRGVASG